VYEAIARPVAMDITRTLGRIMHLPSVTDVLFAGNTGQALQAGATINYEGAPAAFEGGTRIIVQMSESTDQTNILGENSFQENQPACWWDRCLGVRLRPIYTSVVMTLRFEVQSRSRVEAEKLRDEFRMRTAMGREQLLHAITYHYGIPAEEFQLLQVIYGLREAVAGYGDTFEAWMRENEVRPPNALPRLTQISNLAGSGLAWVFGERQVSVQGMFDFRVAPEAPDKNDPQGMYTYPIEYRVRYDKPIGMSMDYPLVVHNQLLPEQYYGKKSVGGWIPDPYSQGCLYSDKTTEIFRKMILNRTLRNRRLLGGVRYPEFDDWVPSAVPAHTSTVYAAMIAVDPDNVSAVCDLKQLEGVIIDGDILQYMASCGSKLGQINNSAIHVSLFQGNGWLGDDAIAVSNDLVVSSTQPLSLRGRYHLRIAVMNDLTLLPQQVRYNLRTQGKACQKILLTLQETMPFATYVPKLMGPRQVVPDDELLAAAWRINAHKKPIQTPLEMAIPMTVGNFFVQARRMSEYAPDASGAIPAAPVPLNQDPNYESIVPGCGQ
jgi:hypothetical protein